MKISVLLATYNRGAILEKTLSNFAQLDTDNIEVEYVIVDNNSNDNTKAIIESFQSKLPIRYLFEPISGKNRALNKAIMEVGLNDIVVFTDDDVNPRQNWLIEIIKAAQQNPEIDVFGGTIELEWLCEQPEWIKQQDIRFKIWAYSYHKPGDKELLYNTDTHPQEPFGPNFWVRKKIFNNNRLFNESVGPTNSSRTRIMGSETEFLRRLQREGCKIIYYPYAIVGHYITANQTTLKYFIKRSLSAGGFRAVMGSFKMPGLYKKYQPLWYFIRYILMLMYLFKHLPAMLHMNKSKRYGAIMKFYTRLGYDRTYIYNTKLVWELTRPESE